jgi:hypothetical protein
MAKHHHTGKIRHEDMVMLHGSTGFGSADPHADVAHTKANREHGMDEGMSPEGGYENEGPHSSGGAPSHSSNCEYS